jgi:hypothetical protein
LGLAGCGAKSEGLSGPDDGAAFRTNCPQGTAILTVPPVVVGDLLGWVPLGALNPPAHTLPTDHQYLYVNDPGQPNSRHEVAVVAPGAITVTGGKSTEYHETHRTDYSLRFQPCADVAGEFGHLETIDPQLLQRLGGFNQGCSSYSPNPGLTVTQCYTKQVAVEVAAGQPLGTVGGSGVVYGLDASFWDRRISVPYFASPGRYPRAGNGFDYGHVVPMSDYFAEPARSAIGVKVGRWDGNQRRTVEPVGGTHASDVFQTAQGNWFSGGAPTYPEGPHLALVPDNVDPTTLVFSIGLSQPGIASGVYSFSPIAGSGTVNRPFREVRADGQIHCYQAARLGVALVQLVTATSLQVEVRSGVSTCAAVAPYAFGSGAFSYQR